ncbi:MAG: choice-of-anchor Q domain-containing protein, partial [Fibrobacterota bacterium]|nr:choice-of-anchor Q domain-containing protein [Chitinispirillaceae bacterium]
ESNSLWANPQFFETLKAYTHSRGEPSSLSVNEAEGRSMIAAFPLSAGSPAIDAGANLGAALQFDFNGLSRPTDGNGDGTLISDIGAFEFTATDAKSAKRSLKAQKADITVLNSTVSNGPLVLRINSAFRDQLHIRILDAAGRSVHTATIPANATNSYRNSGFFDYRISEKLSNGIYTAVVSGRQEFDAMHANARFVIIH